jgi:hypothetical protein
MKISIVDAVHESRSLGHKAMLARDPVLDFLISDAWLGGLLVAGMAKRVLASTIVIAGTHSALRPD